MFGASRGNLMVWVKFTYLGKYVSSLGFFHNHQAGIDVVIFCVF